MRNDIRLMMEDLDTMTPGEVAEKMVELEAQLDQQKDEYEGLLDVAESNYKKLEAQLADMTLARDELQKMHDMAINRLMISVNPWSRFKVEESSDVTTK
jgi:hypothetical protein